MPASIGQQAKLGLYKNLLTKRRNKDKTISEVLGEHHRPHANRASSARLARHLQRTP